MARDEGRPLATSSLAVGRFAAKKGSLRSPRGRLVASLRYFGRLRAVSYFSLQSLPPFSLIRDFPNQKTR